MTILTDAQIESTLTQCHANIIAVASVTREQRVVDLAITRELRAAFTAGKDHGEATIVKRATDNDALNAIEEGMRVHGMSTGVAIARAYLVGHERAKQDTIARAAELVAPAIGNAEHEALGRSMATIFDWVAACGTRSFQGTAATTDGRAEYAHHAWVMRDDSDKVREGSENWSEFAYGSTRNEALAKLAQWCTNHSEQYPVHPPTLPAPPPDESTDTELEQ